MRACDQSSIFGTGGKFRPDYGLLLELHALTLVTRSYVLLVIPYNGKLLKEKTLANWRKNKQTIFAEKTFVDWSLLLHGRTPHSQISQWKLSRIYPQNHKIGESFLPRKFPAIQYYLPQPWVNNLVHCVYTLSILRVYPIHGTLKQWTITQFELLFYIIGVYDPLYSTVHPMKCLESEGNVSLVPRLSRLRFPGSPPP